MPRELLSPSRLAHSVDRCRNAAEDTPLPGTAPRAARWWLVEHRGPWSAQPIVQASETWLRDWGRRSGDGGRVILVRPHGRSAPATSRRIWTFAPGEDAITRCELAYGEDPGPLDLGQRPSGVEWHPSVDHPALVVCTNGRRDQCCATWGRALLDELPREVAPRVWECTHLGGHRFAPTGLLVPSGFVLGRLQAPAVHRAVVEGRLDLACVRGRSDLTAPEQVAEHEARRVRGIDDLGIRLTARTLPSPEEPVSFRVRIDTDPYATDAHGGSWPLEVTVAGSHHTGIVSCGQSPETTRVWRIAS